MLKRIASRPDLVRAGVLVLLCLALYFMGLGQRHLWDADEGLHASTSKVMVQTGNWLVPQFNGEPFYDKPPLFNWLVALSFVFFGFTEFAARFPAALIGAVTVLATYRFGRQLVSESGAFLGAIVLATSGMLNGGPVMEYFKNWADNPNNTMIFVGYQAEGTLGRRPQRGWSEVPFTERGKAITVKVRMQIETSEGFSGHSDRKQLANFVQNINPKPDRIIFVHGEESKVLELSSAIHRKFNLETRAPKNLETVRLN